MSELFPHLFSPLPLRHKRLKNRVTFGAHTTDMSEAGLPADRHFGYYRERARGGAAMIVVEPTPAHPTGILIRGNFRVGDDSLIAPFRGITDACHEYDTVMIHQIYHVGAHGDGDNSWLPNWSPSGTASHHDGDGSHAMTEAEIEEVIEGFAEQARRDRDAGFDGIELFAAYHALIDQFWSPLTNHRGDRWGGSLENRLRFTVEIIERIRRKVGDDFIIGMAISGAEPYPGGLSLADKAEIAAWLDERGLVDYFSLGTGSYLNRFDLIVAPFMYDSMLGPPDAAVIKQAVKQARVQAESRIKTPANAETVIATGQADLVSIVRGQIADPHLANKAAQGRPEDIRPCISCNQQCIGRRLRDYWISCLVNPSAGREMVWAEAEANPTPQPKRVLVIGAGPAGMEAARVAAGRGHWVTLVERTDRLGGQLRLAAKQPKRQEVGDFLGWLERQLARLEVEVRLETDLSASQILALGYDEIVLATGSRPPQSGFQRALPHVARLPGVERENVVSLHDAFEGRASLGRRVLVLDDDGDWRGSGTALYLAEQGHQVTLLTPSLFPGPHLTNTLSTGAIMTAFARQSIRTITSSALLGVGEGSVTILNLLTGETREEAFDTVVLATLQEARTKLADALTTAGATPHLIGDCLAPRQATMAIYEARKLALAL